MSLDYTVTFSSNTNGEWSLSNEDRRIHGLSITNSQTNRYQTGKIKIFNPPSSISINDTINVDINNNNEFSGYVSRTKTTAAGTKVYDINLIGKTFDLWKYNIEDDYYTLDDEWTTTFIYNLISGQMKLQGGSLGYSQIVEGTGQRITGPISYENYTIGDALVAVSKYDGHRFYVDKDNEVHYYKSSQTQTLTISDSDVIDYTPFEESDDDLVNWMLVEGDSGVSVKVSSQSSIDKYGKYIKRYKNSKIKTDSDATKLGNSFLSEYDEPTLKGTVTITGDTSVELDKLFTFDVASIDISGTHEIKGYTHNIDRKKGYTTKINFGRSEYNPAEEFSFLRENQEIVEDAVQDLSTPPGIDGSLIYNSSNSGFGGTSKLIWDYYYANWAGHEGIEDYLKIGGSIDITDDNSGLYFSGDDNKILWYNNAGHRSYIIQNSTTNNIEIHNGSGYDTRIIEFDNYNISSTNIKTPSISSNYISGGKIIGHTISGAYDLDSNTDMSIYNNSGIMWEEASGKWVAMASGGSGGGGSVAGFDTYLQYNDTGSSILTISGASSPSIRFDGNTGTNKEIKYVAGLTSYDEPYYTSIIYDTDENDSSNQKYYLDFIQSDETTTNSAFVFRQVNDNEFYFQINPTPNTIGTADYYTGRLYMSGGANYARPYFYSANNDSSHTKLLIEGEEGAGASSWTISGSDDLYNNTDMSIYDNSGILWNNTASRWEPMPSGGSGGGGLSHIREDTEISSWDATEYSNSGLMWNGSGWEARNIVPGGSDTQVQYNNNGSFGGNQNFTYDSSNDIIWLSGTNGMTIRSNAHRGQLTFEFESCENDYGDPNYSVHEFSAINKSSQYFDWAFNDGTGLGGGMELWYHGDDTTTLFLCPDTNPTYSSDITWFPGHIWMSGNTTNYARLYISTGQYDDSFRKVLLEGEGGGGGTPGGSDTQIQYNDGDSFGGAAGMVWDDVNDKLSISGTTVFSGSTSFTADTISGMTSLTVNGGISGTSLSGSWSTPIYRGEGKPAAGAEYEGQIIRTSGSTGEGTWVWICVINSADSYEWIQLGMSS
jgi:hypothetical protein